MRIELDFMAVLSQWPLLATGVLWTLGLTAISAVLGLVVGTLCAWARNSGPVWLRWVVGAYVELIRNTPFIVQLFFVFFGLPAAGVKLTPELASVIAMWNCASSCASSSGLRLAWAASILSKRVWITLRSVSEASRAARSAAGPSMSSRNEM